MNEENKIKVLLIDDDEDDYILIRDLLREGKETKFSLDWAPTFSAGRSAIGKAQHDLYLVDYRLGEGTGLDLLDESISLGGQAPIIVLTGQGDKDVDLEAMRRGAADYLIKGTINYPILERSIRYALYRARSIADLKDRESNIRSLLDSVFAGLFVHALEGTILDANRTAQELLDRSVKELVGANLYDFCEPVGRKRLMEAVLESQPAVIELTARKAGGEDFIAEAFVKPYQFKGQTVRLTAVRDITYRKEVEAKLLLQDRLASTGLLASGLAHEIGTPLGVIRGRAEYLLMQVGEDESIKKTVKIIIGQIDRVSQLIRSLLNLARGESTSQVATVEVNTVATDLLDLMGHQFRKHSIRVDNLLPADPPVLVKAESQALHQVFLNFLVNSVHAIDEAVKGGRVADHFIRIEANNSGPMWSITFSDSGCGISKDNLRELFKPFFTTKEIGIGTGLGLATSYQLVHSWGGEIEVESKEGQGATFRVKLPRASA